MKSLWFVPAKHVAGELCEKASTVDDGEVPTLFAELKALLQEHSEAVRFSVAKTLNRTRHAASSKVA